MSTYSIPYYNQMNGNYNNGMPQQTTAANQQAFPQQQQPTTTGNASQQQQQAAATAAAAAVQQPYNYMFYQQQGQPGQQTGQTAGQQQQQQQQQQQYDYNTYNRYQYPAATSQGNYYQQTIPNQLSQPQPQHYNGSNRNYTSAPSGAPYLPPYQWTFTTATTTRSTSSTYPTTCIDNATTNSCSGYVERLEHFHCGAIPTTRNQTTSNNYHVEDENFVLSS